MQAQIYKTATGRRYLKVGSTRVGIDISAGPWAEGVDPALLKLHPRGDAFFPSEIIRVLPIENESDPETDYFEADSIPLLPGHPLYAQAKGAV